jgi:hypothetical protein
VRIAILGCGPSGLVAAHAASQLKIKTNIQVYSAKRRSPIYGAQYLHQPIPGVFAAHEVEPDIIRYNMVGSPESYLKKVYGEAWDGTISDDLRDQAHVAWDLRSTYDELWMRYADLIVDYSIIKGAVEQCVRPLVDNYDIVINTIPRPALCLKPRHQFVSTEIWAAGETPDQPFPVECADNVIVYNGDSNPSWYRSSRIHGHSTVEWPGHTPKPPVPGVARVKKPLRHSCDCWTDQIVHLGRMGRWQNGTLVHHVYADMYEQLILLGERMGVA